MNLRQRLNRPWQESELGPSTKHGLQVLRNRSEQVNTCAQVDTSKSTTEISTPSTVERGAVPTFETLKDYIEWVGR